MKKLTMIMGMALALSAATAIAQPSGDQGPGKDGPPPGREGHHGRRPPSPLVKALDANGDGVIDATEIANAAAALKKLDTNNDGQLTMDELMPRRPDGSAGGPPPGPDGKMPPPPPLIAALDANGDGVIDASEIANAPAALLKLDKNGDGKLTPDEYRPHRPPPGGPPPEGDGNGGPGGPKDAPPGQ